MNKPGIAATSQNDFCQVRGRHRMAGQIAGIEIELKNDIADSITFANGVQKNILKAD
jgi:hypothetical protein